MIIFPKPTFSCSSVFMELWKSDRGEKEKYGIVFLQIVNSVGNDFEY